MVLSPFHNHIAEMQEPHESMVLNPFDDSCPSVNMIVNEGDLMAMIRNNALVPDALQPDHVQLNL
jgi:hypothetical protein